MPRSKKRKGAKKYQAAKTIREKLERKAKPRLYVEYESFFTVDQLILHLRTHDSLDEQQGALFFYDEKMSEIDVVFALREWMTQWKAVGRHADIDYDDSALRKIIAKLENGSMVFQSDLDALQALVDVQRHLYRSVPNSAIRKGLEDFNALNLAAKKATAMLSESIEETHA